MMVKDEADIIEPVLTHWLSQDIDFLLVSDNVSTDGTLDILMRLAKSDADQRVCVVGDDVVAYYQSKKMTVLAHVVGEIGCEWIIPCDADELWYSEEGTIGSYLRSVPRETNVLQVPLWNHYPTKWDDSTVLNPFLRSQHRHKDVGKLPKVCFRYATDCHIMQGNHDVRFETANGKQLISPLAIRHFPYRSESQFIRKCRNGAEAYRQATDIPEYEGAHWRQYGRILEKQGESGLRYFFNDWFYFQESRRGELVLDPAPYRGIQ